MSCPELDELRSLLEGEIAADRIEPVNEHVDGCGACQASLEQLTQVPDGFGHHTDDTTVRSDDHSVMGIMGQLRGATPSGWDPVEDWADEAIEALTELGRYEDIEPLARGGSGLLFRAREVDRDRMVAIKIWPRRFLGKNEHAERVRREAVALSRLQHQHIVRIFEVGTCIDQSAFIAMQLIEGDTLSALVRRGHSIPPQRAATIVRDVASALAAVHAAGLVHRDIKPSNILIERATSDAKLVDFGLVLDEKDDIQLTQDGSIAGTPQYMSPEQIRDPHQVDARSDIYSLGIVLYELLTGSRPYRGVMRMVLFKVLNEEPQAPSKFDDSIPRDLETICLKAITKEPHLRYESAKELELELQRWLDRKPVLTRRPSWLLRVARWSRRNKRVASLIAAVCTLVSLLAIGGPLASISIARARNEAERQQVEASQQRDIALQTLEKMVFEISERFEAGGYDTGPAQNALLQTAIDGLEQVADRAESDFFVCRALAGAHARLAGLLFQLEEPMEDIRSHLEEARKFLEIVRDAEPRDFQVLTTDSYLEWYEARLLLDEAEALDDEQTEAIANLRKRALELLQSSVEIDEVRLFQNPDDANVLHDATVSYEVLTQVAMRTDLDVAEQSARRAIALAKRMEEQLCPEDHEMSGMILAAKVAKKKGNFDSAREYADKLLARISDKVEVFVQDNDEQIYLDISHLRETYLLVAELEAESGDLTEAKRWLEKGIKAMDRVEAADIEWQTDRSPQGALQSRLDELQGDEY